MTLLTTVQRATDLIGIPRPSIVVNSLDQSVRQLYRFANEALEDLMQAFDWKAITKQQTFTTTAAAIQTGAIPSDWNRFIDGSMFNRDQRRRVLGPITEQQWQLIQANSAASPIYQAFMLRGTDYLMTPTPAAGETVAYSYVSDLTVLDVDGTTYKSEYTADNDTALLDERLISYSLRWRFQQAKGLDYAESMETYERERQKLAARDKGMPTLSAGGEFYYLPNWPNIPDGSWPGT